jgi:hypothetical protein
LAFNKLIIDEKNLLNIVFHFAKIQCRQGF